MNNIEILKKAIEIAVERGWKESLNYSLYLEPEDTNKKPDKLNELLLALELKTKGYFAYIFSHQFCKALFGERKEEWLGKFVWYSLYEQDSEIFKDYKELMNSWIFYTEDSKPTINELNSLSEDGLEVAAGKLVKDMEITNQGWQYHLTQMVLYEDPLEYLKEYQRGYDDGVEAEAKVKKGTKRLCSECKKKLLNN